MLQCVPVVEWWLHCHPFPQGMSGSDHQHQIGSSRKTPSVTQTGGAVCVCMCERERERESTFVYIFSCLWASTRTVHVYVCEYVSMYAWLGCIVMTHCTNSDWVCCFVEHNTDHNEHQWPYQQPHVSMNSYNTDINITHWLSLPKSTIGHGCFLTFNP